MNGTSQATLVLVFLAACGAPVTTSDSGSDASASDATALDASAPNDAPNDALAPDAFAVDALAPSDACVGETDAVLCAAASAECDTVGATDRCGRARTASCGACPGAQTCGARGTPNRCAYAHWDVVTVDDDHDPGRALSLASAAGHLRVAYRATSGAIDVLRVAHFDAGTWTVEDLDSGALVAVDTSIALDATGTPHVAAPGPVRGGTASYAELFVRSSTGWARSATVPGSATYVGLALDASGLAQICAYDPPSGGFGGFLVHVSEDSAGVFTSRTIDGAIGSSTSRTGISCSIAIDTSGTLHAAYYDGNFGRLRYASRSGIAPWSPVSVDAPSGDFAGDDAFMRLAPDQTPMIVYRAGVLATREIRRARPSGATWSHDTIEPSAGAIANYPSLAFDAAGGAHVTYFDSTTGTFYYAHDTASGWVREVLDVVGTGTGGESVIAIGAGDSVDVVYYDSGAHRLRHAHRVP